VIESAAPATRRARRVLLSLCLSSSAKSAARMLPFRQVLRKQQPGGRGRRAPRGGRSGSRREDYRTAIRLFFFFSFLFLFFFHHCSSHSSYSSRQSSSIAFNREIDKYESRTLHSPHTDCRCRLHAVFNRPVDQSRIVIDVPWPHAQHVSGHEAIPSCAAQREGAATSQAL